MATGASCFKRAIFRRHEGSSAVNAVRKAKALVFVFSKCEQGSSLLIREKALNSLVGTLNEPDSVQGEVSEMSSTRKEYRQNLMFLHSDSLQFLMLDYSQYSDGKTCLELENNRY